MSFIVEAFFSGCISKVVNDGTDFSVPKIKSVINDKKNRNLSTKIYRIIERALILVIDKKFKDTDKLYDAIERIFIEFRDNGDTLESVRCGLRLLNSDVSIERCENFLDKFYDGVCQDEDLYKRISLILQEKGIKINQQEFQQINETIEGGFAQLNRKMDEKISINNNKDNLQNRESVKSRTQEYLDRWNANMFLNDFSEWDENAGVNVKLKDVYIEAHLPHFIWGNNSSESTDLKRLLSKYIYEKDENKMLLILGQPGIGKSTLITWMIANFSDRVDDILVYKFASDLKNIRWKDFNDLADYILNELNLSYNDLDGKTLIIDGFDEIRVEERILLLNRWHWNWVLGDLSNNFSLIITCRENYIQDLYRVHSDYITLQQWDEIQIKSFCDIFQEKTNKSVSDATIERFLENRSILGIPLILYMVLALEISIEKDGSIVDVYDKIFSLEDGGIYDRCLQNKRYEGSHRISGIKEQIHQISREIAIWMFENNPDEACIPQEEYQKICNHIMKDYVYEKEDFKIGNFFKSVKHCEGTETEQLYFVHRSIYEYFVAETIYSSIENAMVELSEESQEEFAGSIAKYLKQGKITQEIGRYLQYKIFKQYRNLYKEKRERFYQWLQTTVWKMVSDGMLYYTKRNIKDIIFMETRCFINLISILRLLMNISGNSYIIVDNNIDLHIHIQCCGMINSVYYIKEYIDLSNMFLEGINLQWMSLIGIQFNSSLLTRAQFNNSNLQSTYFKRSILDGANFEKALLSDSQLTKASLIEVNFRDAILITADLEECDLTNANLTNANLMGANLSGAVLRESNMQGSIWYNDDIEKVRSELRDAQFAYIIVEDQEKRRRVYRSELFPDEK